MLEKNNKISMSASCICYENGGLWFVHAQLPLLCYTNIQSGEVEVVKIIPCEKQKCSYMFRGIYAMEDKIVLIPSNTKNIMIYLKHKDMFKKIEIENACSNMFRGYIKDGEWLYLKPYCYGKIVRFNYVTEQVEYGTDWKEKVELNDCISAACKADNEYLNAIWNKNYILKYNAEEKNIERFILPGISEISQIVYRKNQIFVYDMLDKTLKRYDCKTNKITKSVYIGIDDGWLDELNNKIVLSTVEKNYWVVFDKNLEVVAEKQNSIEKYSFQSDYCCIEWTKDEKGNIYGIDVNSNLIQFSGNEISQKKIELNNKCWKLIGNRIANIFKEKVWKENEIFDLKDLLLTLKK